MAERLDEEKAELRKRIREKLQGAPSESRQGASSAARQLLKLQPVWSDAQSVLLYAPLSDELDVWDLGAEILASGKLLALPKFDPKRGCYAAAEIKTHGQSLKRGQFGIREPDDACPSLELKRLDLILVPGVAFDLAGRRLGRGRGFYDQMLKLVRGTTLGVAFDEQIVHAVPAGSDDVPVNCILTPTRWIACDATTRGL